jgi:hypothetical protein
MVRAALNVTPSIDLHDDKDSIKFSITHKRIKILARKQPRQSVQPMSFLIFAEYLTINKYKYEDIRFRRAQR